MTREIAKKVLFCDECKRSNDKIVDKIFNYFENRTCSNCEYCIDEVCANDESPLCTDFISKDYGCILWKSR